MTHQYVVLPSNSSMNMFPDNTLANYKVKLTKPLILDGKYEVALVEIIYPHRRLTVEPQEAAMFVKTREKVKKVVAVTVVDKTDVDYDVDNSPNSRTVDTRFVLPSRMYENPQTLASSLNGMTKDVSFWLMVGSNKFQVKLARKVLKVELSGRMAQLLGFTNKHERYVLTKSEGAKYLPHLEGNAHSLYIYSSIVDHQVVGDTTAPLLRVVCPDAEKLGQTVSEKYIKPYYLPVNTSYIDTIDIQIRTTSGHLFPFLSGSPVVVSLHFQRID